MHLTLFFTPTALLFGLGALVHCTDPPMRFAWCTKRLRGAWAGGRSRVCAKAASTAAIENAPFVNRRMRFCRNENYNECVHQRCRDAHCQAVTHDATAEAAAQASMCGAARCRTDHQLQLHNVNSRNSSHHSRKSKQDFLSVTVQSTSLWITCSSVALAAVLRFSPVMGFVTDKIIAPLAGQAAKHTSPDVGHKAVDALGADTVCVWGHTAVAKEQQPMLCMRQNRKCCVHTRRAFAFWRTMDCWCCGDM